MTTECDTKVVELIQKLLNLSESSNEHEASLAMEKAQADQDTRSQYSERHIQEWWSQHPAESRIEIEQ